MPDELKLGVPRPWGEKTCGFGLEKKAECDQLAKWHLMWVVDDSTAQACNEHLDYIRRRQHGLFKMHSFGENCGEAGTFFFTPDEDPTEGFCYFGDVPAQRFPEAVENWLDA